MTWRSTRKVRSLKVERLLKSKYAMDFLEAIKRERNESSKAGGRIIVKRIGGYTYAKVDNQHIEATQ